MLNSPPTAEAQLISKLGLLYGIPENTPLEVGVADLVFWNRTLEFGKYVEDNGLASSNHSNVRKPRMRAPFT